MGEDTLEFELQEKFHGQIIAVIYYQGSRLDIEGLGQSIPDALNNLARNCDNEGFYTKQDIIDYVMKGSNALHRDFD